MRTKCCMWCGCILLLATVAHAESALVVIDSVGADVGAVATVNDLFTEAHVLYRLDSGGFAVFAVNDGWFSQTKSFVMSFYESADCTGTPYIQQPEINWYKLLEPLHRITWSEPTATTVIVSVSHSAVVTSVSHQSRGWGYECTADVGTSNLVQATYVENLRTLTGPFKIIPNPSIFWDQFQTGDLTRWSNY